MKNFEKLNYEKTWCRAQAYLWHGLSKGFAKIGCNRLAMRCALKAMENSAEWLKVMSDLDIYLRNEFKEERA